MFLVSVNCEYENKIKGKLKSLYNEKVTIFTEDDILEHDKYKKYNYVITEYNKDVIDYFTKEKKIIIIMGAEKDNNKIKSDNIYYCNNLNDIQDVVKTNGLKKKIPKNIIVLFILLIALLGLFVIVTQNDNVMEKENTKKITNKKKETKKQNSDVDIKAQNIVFLGDSITEFYHLEDYYDESIPVVNSGIAGNKAYDILTNMDERVYRYNPTKVFLLVGTNDLFHRTDPEIANNIADIVREIHKHRKNAEVYVESIYPVNNKTEGNDIVVDWMVGERDNERIKEINKKIKENSKDYDYTYLDFYSMLEGEDGLLKLEYTVDGLHISDEGYKLITKEIMKIIEGEGNE